MGRTDGAGHYSTDFNLSEEVQRFEAELIRSALSRTGGRLRQTARLLGVKVTTLHNKIERYGINAGKSAHQYGIPRGDGEPVQRG